MCPVDCCGNCGAVFNEKMLPGTPLIPHQSYHTVSPFWSVMIPTYNARADYLEETLRSVLQQDPGPDQMQIEVIDDASSNGAPTEFVRKLAGKRVAVHC